MAKEKPLYRRILREASGIIWHNKFLWFFGLFATFLGSGEYNLIVNGFSRSTSDKPLTLGILDIVKNLIDIGFFKIQTLGNLKEVLIKNPFSFFMLVLILGIIIGIAIFIIWLVIISQASLINATKKISSAAESDLHQEINENRGYFWQIFALDFISKFITWILFVLIGLVVFVSAVKATIFTMLLFMVAFIIFLSLSIIIAFITKYAVCFVVLKKKKWFDSIKSAINLFFSNWVVSLELALSLFVIDIVVKIVFVSIVLLIAAPIYMTGLLAFYFNLKISFWLIIIMPVILLSVLVFIMVGILTAFQYSSWTLLFAELTGKKTITSKIARLASSLSKNIMGD